MKETLNPITISWSQEGLMTIEYEGSPPKMLRGTENEARRRAERQFESKLMELRSYAGLSWIEG
jgi:hypothetical protein